MASRPLSQWIALVVAGVITLTGLLAYTIIDHWLDTAATARINNRARALMETMISIREYTASHTAPIIEPLNFSNSERFMPESVPSYAAKSVFNVMRTMPQYSTYGYREAVTNPTNSQDLPSELEALIIERFRSNPKLKEVSGNDINPVLPFHYTARPLIVTGESCLACHSSPERAPASLLNTYGPKNGFNWKIDEIIGVQIVKVPFDRVLEKKEEMKKGLVGLIITSLAALAFIISLVLNSFVVRPLAKLSSLADAASENPSNVSFSRVGPVEELNRLQQIGRAHV